jgi:hypothetical protein
VHFGGEPERALLTLRPSLPSSISLRRIVRRTLLKFWQTLGRRSDLARACRGTFRTIRPTEICWAISLHWRPFSFLYAHLQPSIGHCAVQRDPISLCGLVNRYHCR